MINKMRVNVISEQWCLFDSFIWVRHDGLIRSTISAPVRRLCAYAVAVWVCVWCCRQCWTAANHKRYEFLFHFTIHKLIPLRMPAHRMQHSNEVAWALARACVMCAYWETATLIRNQRHSTFSVSSSSSFHRLFVSVMVVVVFLILYRNRNLRRKDETSGLARTTRPISHIEYI